MWRHDRTDFITLARLRSERLTGQTFVWLDVFQALRCLGMYRASDSRRAVVQIMPAPRKTKAPRYVLVDPADGVLAEVASLDEARLAARMVWGACHETRGA